MASHSALVDAASVLGLDLKLMDANQRIALYQAWATEQVALKLDMLAGTADHALSARIHNG